MRRYVWISIVKEVNTIPSGVNTNNGPNTNNQHALHPAGSPQVLNRIGREVVYLCYLTMC
jgi:hypothetical protein